MKVTLVLASLDTDKVMVFKDWTMRLCPACTRRCQKNQSHMLASVTQVRNKIIGLIYSIRIVMEC
jgi:hypothetical protein